MHIGIFSDSINIPPKEGINVHTYNLALGLASVPGVSVTLVVCDRGWLDLEILDQQPFDTVVLPVESFYNQKYITYVIDHYRLDVLQTYMVYFAAIVLGKASFQTKKPMCVEFHDIESEVAKIYRLDPEEIKFHESMQLRAGSLASLIRVMSLYDYEIILKMWPELASITTWLPVSIENHTKIESLPSPDRSTSALFIGNTSYPPNAAAASYIQDWLAPHVPEVQFSLVGRGSEEYKGPNIKSYGIVESLDSQLASHDVGLAPIFSGSGMKIKLLDYLSAGMPVITTSLGARGYPKSSSIIIEDDTRKWPATIRDVVTDATTLKCRSEQAKELFLNNFDFKNSIAKVVELYDKLEYSPSSEVDDYPDIAVDQTKLYWLGENRAASRSPTEAPLYYKGTLSC